LRYFFHIAFIGTNYIGWQKLPGITTIQQTIEDAVSKVIKQQITIVGCGRTDTGVHASQYFFHADINQPWNNDYLYRINKCLPDSIAVYDIIPMNGLPHARFDAIQRQYDYYIHTYKDPYLSNVSSLYLINDLRIDKMQQAVELLPKYNDYHAFCKSPTKNKHTICEVSEASLHVNDKSNRYRFHITSNRFLSGMIRIIVAKLLEIGQGELSVEAFEDLLKGKKAATNIKLAYPQGLHLSKITYPYLDLPTQLDVAKHNPDQYWHS
jgi:tRNA pseudouridine38-40 synthase